MTKRTYRYYDFLMAAFVTLLICSNLVGAGKVVTLWGLSFSAATLFFPLTYVFGDVLTEVYGYARDRRVVWVGFAAMLFTSGISWIVVQMPAAEGWPHQAAYETVFGHAPRIALASLLAFFAGSFSNAFVLAKMKIWTQGRQLWTRTIGSTLVGEAIDTAIFFPLAFWGIWSPDLLMAVMLTQYVLKCGWEILMTPVTYKAVGFLKRAEGEDYYDHETNFSPFSVQA